MCCLAYYVPAIYPDMCSTQVYIDGLGFTRAPGLHFPVSTEHRSCPFAHSLSSTLSITSSANSPDLPSHSKPASLSCRLATIQLSSRTDAGADRKSVV